MANSVDSDQTPNSEASYLGPHCLLRPMYLNSIIMVLELIFNRVVLFLALALIE